MIPIRGHVLLRKWIWPLFLLAVPGCGPSQRSQAVETGLKSYAELARSAPVDNRQTSGSLWSESAGYSDAFRDVKARRVADIVTIQVLESTSALSEATTESVKESEVNTSVNRAGGLERRITELPQLVDTSNSAQFSGDSSTRRTSLLRTSIAAMVIEVFPNGNLLLEGNRELLINGERQVVTVRGIARPTDITFQNTVSSAQVSELEVEVQGEGIVTDAQKPGILFKILSGVFWPF